jgi:hypothetical protein
LSSGESLPGRVKAGHLRVPASVSGGFLSLAVTAGSFALTLAERSGSDLGDTVIMGALVGFFVGPLLAVGNMAYVSRDHEAGLKLAAAAGLALSALSVLLVVRAFAWMD